MPTKTASGVPDYGFRYYSPGMGRWVSRDPIGEADSIAINGFVQNDPESHIDACGLAKLSFVFEFLSPSFSDPFRPDDAVFVRKADEMLKRAKDDVGLYDPKGVCDNCIENLTISNHGGGDGVIPLGDIDFSGPLYEDYLEKQSKLSPEEFEKYLKRKKYMQDVATAHATLAAMAGLMCEKGRVTVLVCYAGHGPGGDSLRKELARMFGPNITIVTYTKECGFWPGGGSGPTFDLFFWTKKKQNVQWR